MKKLNREILSSGDFWGGILSAGFFWGDFIPGEFYPPSNFLRVILSTGDVFRTRRKSYAFLSEVGGATVALSLHM